MSLRRSSRLKAKEEERALRRTPSQKQVYSNATESSDSDSDDAANEELVAMVTPRSKITPQKINNFTKV